ncbi:MAG: hypothetical protein JJE39_01950 [Vicinamibacteria bacterium]|nr:hypothetical protein [Vicinamibacteria bacterium]
MRLAKSFVFISLAAFVAVACGKGPAQAAITAAESAVSGAQAEGEKFVPEQFKALSDSLASAKSKFDSGDYKGAQEAAEGVPAQAQAVTAAAEAKKTELMESWKSMEGSLPGMVADIQKKVMELATARKLPAGLDKAGLESAKTALEGATAMWAEAGAAFGAGDLMGAVAKASQVKATAEQLMGQLGMSPAPATDMGESAKS